MKKNGFTLVELLAVIVVIGLIVTLAVTNVIPIFRKSKTKGFANDAITLAEAAKLKYKDDKLNNIDDDLYEGSIPGKKCYSIEDYLLGEYASNLNTRIQGSVEVCYGLNCDYDTKIWMSDGSRYINGKIIDENTNVESLIQTDITALNYSSCGVNLNTEPVLVYLNTNGGETIEPLTIRSGNAIGVLPTPIRSGYNFDAWYTDQELTNIVTEELVINDQTNLYAKWYSPNDVARIGHTYYSSLSTAITDALPNVTTEVVILKDFSFGTQITITNNKIIDFNLNNHTYTFTATGASSVFNVNTGELHLSNGSVTSAASSGMIDVQTNGKLYITSGTYTKTSQKQVIYNNGGRVTISGDPILKTQVSSSTNERAVIHNLNNGSTYIQGGTIISDGVSTENSCKSSVAVCNESGTVEIGVQGGTFSTTSPVLQANAYGVVVTGSNNVYFYDGIVKGYTNAFNTAPTSAYLESGKSIINGTEQIGTKTFKTAKLG